MKTSISLIIAGLAILLVASTASAAVLLLKETMIAKVGSSGNAVTVHRIVDGEITCYVTRFGQDSAHAISCVK